LGAETNQGVVVSAKGGEVAAEGTKREVAARIWDLVG